MCGIAGLIDMTRRMPREEGEMLARRMAAVMIHRGPDAAGLWSDAEVGVYLSHRRLAIIDLSPGGAQPMVSSGERFVICYNGEIYNFPELRQRLEDEGLRFRSTSDTEILLEAFAHWGIERTLGVIKGMFAIALWDRQARQLHLIRDHFGKKPLYVGVLDGKLVFASELKAIRAASKAVPAIDRQALTLYTRYGYVPAPFSIYQNIYKLPPAHRLTIDAERLSETNLQGQMRGYWSLQTHQDLHPREERMQALEYMLTRAVTQRMVADVKLGSFLSGGIDSSLVTAIMQRHSPTPVDTFCIGFEEGGFDESPHAAAIAKYLGTNHHAYTVTAEETREVIPLLPDIYDEPFADYSQIPTYHVCRIARKNTTVVLSGDGGDEMFCGYSRYFMALQLYERMKFMPWPVWALAGQMLAALPESLLTQGAGLATKIAGVEISARRLHTIARFMGARHFDDLMRRVMSVNQRPMAYVRQAMRVPVPPAPPLYENAYERMMMRDIHDYLPDDILVKVDRASMANSLEVRAPLLDKDLAEFAWGLPLEDKIFPGQRRGKRALYELLGRYVPEELIDRPKQGFTVPLAAWLRGPLKDWAEDLLSAEALRAAGLFEERRVRGLWRQFQIGAGDHHAALWTIMMAQAWHNRWNRA